MADSTQSYDQLAAHYDQIFESWEASILRQASVLGGILRRECADTRPIRVLDCACGIGTQSLGLAMKGFEVEGCDISSGAVQRARLEASKRGLSVPFSVANMLQLTALGRSSFDAVICIDNALPHLESDEQLLQAAQQAHAKLRAGGSFIGSIRDYDRFIVERPTAHGPSFYSDRDRRRMVFQIWDWLDERCYRFHLSSRKIHNRSGRRSISPPYIAPCFAVNWETFCNGQDSSRFVGCRRLTAVFTSQSSLRTVAVETGKPTPPPENDPRPATQVCSRTIVS